MHATAQHRVRSSCLDSIRRDVRGCWTSAKEWNEPLSRAAGQQQDFSTSEQCLMCGVLLILYTHNSCDREADVSGADYGPYDSATHSILHSDTAIIIFVIAQPLVYAVTIASQCYRVTSTNTTSTGSSGYRLSVTTVTHIGVLGVHAHHVTRKFIDQDPEPSYRFGSRVLLH